MIHQIKRMVPLVFIVTILASSCTNAKINTQEQTEIARMDSTAHSVKESTDKLEDQTRKVEASLEKLDNEFKPNN